MRIGIINYGVGNLGSVEGALKRIGSQFGLIDDPAGIGNFDKLILPGVGNFEECSDRLKRGGWFEVLKQVAIKRKPILGICLGMQLLATSSTEVNPNQSNLTVNGLGLIPGSVKHLSELECKMRIPHVGWNEVSFTADAREMFKEIPDKSDFYFVHSYAFVPDSIEDIAATTNYGVEFASAVRNGNIWGAQFHPEKSSLAGIKFLKNFIEF
jgi:glutamine amidotransferase